MVCTEPFIHCLNILYIQCKVVNCTGFSLYIITFI